MPLDSHATTIISALRAVPKEACGMVRDIRVRWALEEIGRPYRTELLAGILTPRSAKYKEWQPFGQVPAYEDAKVRMFESGAILLHLGEQDERLLPKEPQARAQAISWFFAALDTVETALAPLEWLDVFLSGKPWTEEAREPMLKMAHMRLTNLSNALGAKPWLTGEFTIADLAMINVLHRAGAITKDYPNLAAYRARGEARPAFKRAQADHISDLGAPVKLGEEA